MKQAKKTVILILLICTVLTSIPLCPSYAAISADSIEAALTKYKNTVFPTGNYWCGGDINRSITSSGCGKRYDCFCNSFHNAYQCQGFALYLAEKTLGTCPAGTLASYYHGKKSNGWTCYTKSVIGTSGLCALGLMPGDLVRAATDSSYANGHTAIVWKVEGGKVYFGECWGSFYSKINWGGFNSYYFNMTDICSKYTYVALWRNDSVTPPTGNKCRHNYVQKYEASHPHPGYMECTLCGDKYYNNKQTTLDTCLCCTGEHNFKISYETAHPHAEKKECVACKYVIYTGNTRKVDTCKYCTSPPYDLSISADKQKYSLGATVTIKFTCSESTKTEIRLYRGDELEQTIDATGKTSVTCVTDSTGIYKARLLCSNENGDAAPIDSKTFTVNVDLAKVSVVGNKAYLLYLDSISESALRTFCTSRGGKPVSYDEAKNTLDAICLEYPSYGFAVENSDGDLTYIGKKGAYNGFVVEVSLKNAKTATNAKETKEYTLYPFTLPYDEARVFADSTGGQLACIADEAENRTIAALISQTELSGALIGATDEATEGKWMWESGIPFEYANWNYSYTGFENKQKNYLYMYRDGTWIDSFILPRSTAGFVTEHQLTYVFTPNATGVTLKVCNDRSESIVIPDSYKGERVTAICSDAFVGLNAKSIAVPSSVTSVTGGAIEGCENTLFKCVKGSYFHTYARSRKLYYILSMPFDDVPDGTWYTAAASYCYERSLMSGTSETAFSPQINVTRAMFVTILAKICVADTSPDADDDIFTDVTPGQWYTAPINWAYNNGLAAGYGDTFRPNEPLTREQLAVFLHNFTDKWGGDTSVKGDLAAYGDASSASAWAVSALSWAVEKGYLSGVGGNMLSPKTSATRAQTAVVMMKYLGS